MSDRTSKKLNWFRKSISNSGLVDDWIDYGEEYHRLQDIPFFMWEVIVKVSAEGGSITLYGMKLGDGTWVYTRETDERTLADILDTEDYESLKDSLRSFSHIVQDWNQAVGLLGRSWFQLSPRYVQQEHSNNIWGLVTKEHIPFHRLRNWAKLCFPDRDEMEKRLNQVDM